LDPTRFIDIISGDGRTTTTPAIDLPSASCDWVYASLAITGSADERAALEEMLRVVGRGSLLLVDDALAERDATSALEGRGERRPRAHGSSYGDALRVMLPQAAILELVGLDSCSLTLDSVYIVSLDAGRLLEIAPAVAQHNIHARVFAPSSDAVFGPDVATKEPASPLLPLAATRGSLPPEFDEHVYRALHADLAPFSDSSLRDHYRRHGQKEGRRAHTIGDRHAFVGLLSPDLDVLEIGPQHAPLVSGPRARYFDLYDKDTLVAQASARGYPTHLVPNIDYVSSSADLGIVDRKFDAVVSSHVVERQPDLVGHLDSVRRLLRQGGLYFALIPDKNYCFDHFMPLTTIADLLAGHLEKRTRHTLRSQIAYAALRTHNDCPRHWRGDHEPVTPSTASIARTIELHSKRDGRYDDVHAWYFEPASFKQSMQLLHDLGETDFTLLRLYPTQTHSNEFWVILEAGGGTP
jgi:SAM-dependent methyltransferase